MTAKAGHLDVYTSDFTLVGADAFVGLLAAYGEGAPEVMARQLYAEALEAFAVSQRQVPRRTGVLAASGQVGTPVIEGSDIVVGIGYGGAAKAYALIVHENLDAHHAPPTKAKYLEDPVNAQVIGLEKRLARALEDHVRGKGVAL